MTGSDTYVNASDYFRHRLVQVNKGGKNLALKLSKRVKSGYVIARGSASSLALLFSLFYSKGLGVENRAIVTIVFVTGLISLTLFTSGFSLGFRSRAPLGLSHRNISAYFWLSILSACAIAITSFLILTLYSQIKSQIPVTLLVLAFVYTFWAALDDLSHQALLAYEKFKLAAIIDVATVLMQIIFYVILNFSHRISLASSLFCSLIISYIISSILALVFVLRELEVKLNFSFLAIRDLLIESKSLQMIGISGGFVDRIDRFLIAWFLPLSFLGSYSVGTSLLAYTRFVPEAVGRLIVAKQSTFRISFTRQSVFRWFLSILLVLFVALSASIMSKVFVGIFLGDSWGLPTSVIMMFALQEILRGYHAVIIADLVVNGQPKFIKRLSVALAPLSLGAGFLGLKFFGGVGVPFGIALTYALLILIATVKSK